MNYCLEPKVLGGAMLAAGPVLTQIVGNKFGWWVGFAFLIVGPILLSMKRRNINQRKSNE